MSLIIKNNNRVFKLPPKGKHFARCFGLIDLGIQKNKSYGSHVQKILIAWELSHLVMENEKPFTIMQRYTANLNPKSKLKSLLESWRRKEFSVEELHGFHIENMLGEPCYLTIDHVANTNSQKYFAKVADIAPPPSCIPCPSLYNQPICFDLDYYTEENYLAIPENIRNKINLSENYKN